jgi:hypothetical protein
LNLSGTGLKVGFFRSNSQLDVDVQVLPGLKLPIPAFFDERKAQDEVERLLY